jgi:hypothetical protein
MMSAMPDMEKREALRIAFEMMAAKYRDADSDIALLATAFVTSGATVEDNERRMGLICLDLAMMGGHLLGVIGEVSPAALDQWFNGYSEFIQDGASA